MDDRPLTICTLPGMVSSAEDDLMFFLNFLIFFTVQVTQHACGQVDQQPTHELPV
jgi:hypothetical protein